MSLWHWLLVRLGFRSEKSLEQIVVEALRADPDAIAGHVHDNNALIRRMKAG